MQLRQPSQVLQLDQSNQMDQTSQLDQPSQTKFIPQSKTKLQSEIQGRLRLGKLTEEETQRYSNEMLFRYMETQGKIVDDPDIPSFLPDNFKSILRDKTNDISFSDYQNYSINFNNYLKYEDLKEFLLKFDRQRGLFNKIQYHRQDTFYFYNLVNSVQGDENRTKTEISEEKRSLDIVDLTKSGEGEFHNNVRNIMLIEFTDWLEYVGVYGIRDIEVMSDFNTEFSKCKRLYNLIKNQKTFLSIIKHQDVLRSCIRNNELKAYLNLYVIFAEYLFNIQTLILQRYCFNNNTSPTFMVPFSSELNALITYDYNYETEQSEPTLQPHALYITDNLVELDGSSGVWVADGKSFLMQPVILQDNYTRLGTYLSKNEYGQLGLLILNSLKGKIYNYVFRHRPTFNDRGEITLPYTWKYLYEREVGRHDLGRSFYKDASVREFIMDYVFQQYAFIGFNKIPDKIGLPKDAFLLNNPFLTDSFKYVSYPTQKEDDKLNGSYCFDITKMSFNY